MPSEKPSSDLGRGIAVVACDVTAIAGVGLLSYGAWLVAAPLGSAVLGGLLIAGSIMVARRL